MIKYVFVFLLFACQLFASVKPLNWSFPRDYGSHFDYNTEWWYFTGHLESEDTTLYGFQLTFFRYTLDSVSDSPSPWNSSQLYSVHFAFSDSSNNRFIYDDMTCRDYFNFVKNKDELLDIDVKSWKLRHENNMFFIDLQTVHGDFTLQLRASKPRIFHGESGVSYKSADRKNYSHYYSHTRLKGSGTFKTKDNIYEFKKASAWMDRELFNSLLGQDQKGWDWFAIQLDNNEEIMVFRVKGEGDDFYSGTIIDNEGKTQQISAKDITLEVIETWTSNDSSYTYPVIWKCTILSREYMVKAVMKNQELHVKKPFSLYYWEGQAIVSGSHQGRAYVEMLPYLKKGNNKNNKEE